MEIERLPLGHSLADKHRSAELKWRGKPPGIPPEMAIEFIARLEAGSTVRKLTGGGKILGPAMVSFDRFKKHCELHPEWAAAEAWRISRVNAGIGKGAARRDQTHCRHGHSLADAFVTHQNGFRKRDCRTCWKIRGQRGGLMKPEALVKVMAALKGGATVNQIIHGRPAGGGKAIPSLRIVDAGILARYRRENPEFDRFVVGATANNNSVGQRIRYAREIARSRIQTTRREINDYHEIRAMIPVAFPDKDDVVSAIFEDLLNGKLTRENVKARVQMYIAAHNRMFPTKFAKFGNSPLVSLDEVMFDDGSATRGDTVSRGLWD
jgi:hypothetical protein